MSSFDPEDSHRNPPQDAVAGGAFVIVGGQAAQPIDGPVEGAGVAPGTQAGGGVPRAATRTHGDSSTVRARLMSTHRYFGLLIANMQPDSQTSWDGTIDTQIGVTRGGQRARNEEAGTVIRCGIVLGITPRDSDASTAPDARLRSQRSRSTARGTRLV